MSKKSTYRVTFHNQGKVYEIYARKVHQSALFGFIEIEDLLFGVKSSVVLDPSEESLKSEFSGVPRTYIPMHAVIRIDEVEKKGHSKITEVSGSGETIAPFPIYTGGKDAPKS
ncbi:MAG: DUF1820 family protein [Gammaproteobacteria bacterium]|jgi:hypothetical protein|nr:DUF1820 family protein [Gammaproteobacteria bacterium]